MTENINNNIISSKNIKKIRAMQQPLKQFYNENVNIIEIGSDEAGRGPLFGRVYCGAVVLPKDDSFDHFKMKDSKKFHSKKKIEDVAEYIKQSSIAWSVKFADESKIDEINILQATQFAMHEAINDVKKQMIKMYSEINGEINGENKELKMDNILLLIDGNYFNPLQHFNTTTKQFDTMNHVLVEGGDNKYTAIAAASILAKTERDKYIEELCINNPELIHRYGIDSNKGYGAKKHMDGIKQYGITKWHRRSFGICKQFV